MSNYNYSLHFQSFDRSLCLQNQKIICKSKFFETPFVLLSPCTTTTELSELSMTTKNHSFEKRIQEYFSSKKSGKSDKIVKDDKVNEIDEKLTEISEKAESVKITQKTLEKEEEEIVVVNLLTQEASQNVEKSTEQTFIEKVSKSATSFHNRSKSLVSTSSSDSEVEQKLSLKFQELSSQEVGTAASKKSLPISEKEEDEEKMKKNDKIPSELMKSLPESKISSGKSVHKSLPQTIDSAISSRTTEKVINNTSSKRMASDSSSETTSAAPNSKFPRREFNFGTINESFQTDFDLMKSHSLNMTLSQQQVPAVIQPNKRQQENIRPFLGLEIDRQNPTQFEARKSKELARQRIQDSIVKENQNVDHDTTNLSEGSDDQNTPAKSNDSVQILSEPSIKFSEKVQKMSSIASITKFNISSTNSDKKFVINVNEKPIYSSKFNYLAVGHQDHFLSSNMNIDFMGKYISIPAVLPENQNRKRQNSNILRIPYDKVKFVSYFSGNKHWTHKLELYLRDGYEVIKKKEPKLFSNFKNLNFVALRICSEYKISEPRLEFLAKNCDFEPEVMEKSWILINFGNEKEFFDLEKGPIHFFSQFIEAGKIFKPKDFHNLLTPILNNSEGLLRDHHPVIRDLFKCSKAINDRSSNFLKEEIRRYTSNSVDLETSINHVLTEKIGKKNQKHLEKEAEFNNLTNISSEISKNMLKPRVGQQRKLEDFDSMKFLGNNPVLVKMPSVSSCGSTSTLESTQTPKKIPFQKEHSNSITQPPISIPETQNLSALRQAGNLDQFVSDLLKSDTQFVETQQAKKNQEEPSQNYPFHLKTPNNFSPGVADWKVPYFQVNYLCNFMPSLVSWPSEEFVCSLSEEHLKFYFEESVKNIVQSAQNS